MTTKTSRPATSSTSSSTSVSRRAGTTVGVLCLRRQKHGVPSPGRTGHRQGAAAAQRSTLPVRAAQHCVLLHSRRARNAVFDSLISEVGQRLRSDAATVKLITKAPARRSRPSFRYVNSEKCLERDTTRRMPSVRSTSSWLSSVATRVSAENTQGEGVRRIVTRAVGVDAQNRGSMGVVQAVERSFRQVALHTRSTPAVPRRSRNRANLRSQVRRTRGGRHHRGAIYCLTSQLGNYLPFSQQPAQPPEL